MSMKKASNGLMPNQMLYNIIIQDYVYFLNSAIVPITPFFIYTPNIQLVFITYTY